MNESMNDHAKRAAARQRRLAAFAGEGAPPAGKANYFAKIMSELTPFPTCAIGQMAHGET
jgi:hypothetical protein